MYLSKTYPVNNWVVSFVVVFVFFLPSCTNDTIFSDDDMGPPSDTMTVEPMDTITGILCDAETIYFELDVLPILKSSCGRQDCHSTGTASSGIKMENYQTVMETGGIKPYMPGETRIFKQIIHDNEEKRMPPQPYDRLTEWQVQVIADWINQGANNFHCDSSTIPCSTDSVSFLVDIAPTIKDACYGCHNQFVHEGGIELLTYEDIKTVALSGSLISTVEGKTGFVRMPFGSVPLSVCLIEKMKAWVEDGALEN